MTAGYSGSSQARKLGLKDGLQVLVLGRPGGWDFDNPPPIHLVSRAETADIVVAFHSAPAEFLEQIDELGTIVFPAGMIWILWPRKSAGHVSDMNENLIRDAALERGLVDVKVAAVDNDWSGLKLVWRKELR
ncbi:DUF3052 family protein [Nocardia sp. 348MFTsu5.1]|uniref:DUF3052 family protein n=1 Tax=Nocardia sp. 348MFTsu5.1 TaxID=1172185 RepID=UPI00035FB5DB|nr:DUF3052 family protein [Nocardia sp. 348MFTsu5.1]